MNEKVIRTTIKDAELFQENTDKKVTQYERYLLLFVRLLCSNAHEEVADFVKNDYYPIEDSLKIVKEYLEETKHSNEILSL